LDDEVAIITGAAQGMGAMHVRKFVDEGAKVVVTDVNEEAGSQLASEVGASATFLKLDVSKQDEWARVVESAESTFGPFTVLVNNAGVGIFAGPEAWRRSRISACTSPRIGRATQPGDSSSPTAA
jgi:3alpha(or 20beta)-hydroxysteroid dehydrogenase